MKTLTRDLLISAAILVLPLAICTPVQAQKRIEDRFATIPSTLRKRVLRPTTDILGEPLLIADHLGASL